MKAQPKTWVWRHRDKKDMMALNRGRKVGTFANPADFTVGEPGRTYWAEVKSCSGDSFPYSQIEPAQRSAATICASIGAPYFFYIHSLKLNRWFTLSAEQFCADVKAGKKSRRFEELTPCTVM
jgi:penicillin-binding protein-related factor A (putative recombinase)